VRLLLDENLSEAVLKPLADLYPGSLHVRQLGHGGASDRDVWRLAQTSDCVLVTRDEDFVRLSLELGAPPKVIWLGSGAWRNVDVVAVLRAHVAAIERLIADAELTVLEIPGNVP